MWLFNNRDYPSNSVCPASCSITSLQLFNIQSLFYATHVCINMGLSLGLSWGLHPWRKLSLPFQLAFITNNSSDRHKSCLFFLCFFVCFLFLWERSPPCSLRLPRSGSVDQANFDSSSASAYHNCSVPLLQSTVRLICSGYNTDLSHGDGHPTMSFFVYFGPVWVPDLFSICGFLWWFLL